MEIANKNPHSIRIIDSLNLQENENPTFGFLSCSQLTEILGNSGFLFSKKEIEFLASGEIRLNSEEFDMIYLIRLKDTRRNYSQYSGSHSLIKSFLQISH